MIWWMYNWIIWIESHHAYDTFVVMKRIHALMLPSQHPPYFVLFHLFPPDDIHHLQVFPWVVFLPALVSHVGRSACMGCASLAVIAPLFLHHYFFLFASHLFFFSVLSSSSPPSNNNNNGCSSVCCQPFSRNHNRS